MPRAAWLAVGACFGAVALGASTGFVVVLIGVAGLCLTAAATGTPWRAQARIAVPIALGVLAIGLRGVAAGPPAPPPAAPEGDGPWIGVVETVGAPRQGTRPATVRLEDPPGVLVAATLPWHPPVVPGDRVQLDGGIRPPPESDYGDYLRKIGAAGTLKTSSVEVLPATDSVGRILEGWRRAAAEGLQRAMPEPEAGLAAGVLIGLRDLVDRDLAAAFTTAGASHVVAISGWNIAIVASTLGALAGGVRRRRRALLTTAGIVIYVAFVGPSPSVVRAAAMAGVALLAREVGRPGSAVAALGWACTALLVMDPAWIDDAGFRLSALATAGILAWGTGLTKRLAGENPGRARRFIADVLGVSFAAQAATTPIVLLDFGRLSLIAPLVNLIVVPLVPAAMATGALALVIGVAAGFGVPGILATLAGLPAWVLYAAMVTTVRIGAGLPLASLALEAPWDVVAAAVSAVLIAVCAKRGDAILARIRKAPVSATPKPQPRAAAGASNHGKATTGARGPRLAALALASATIALALALAYRPDGSVHVIVMDVGQGDGILVLGDKGGRMVVDGGPDPAWLLLALDERVPPWDRRIDILVLTHPHEDHVAGLAPLLERYKVGRVYEPGMIGPGPGYDAWAAIFANGGPPRGRLSTGDRVTLDSIHFRVLWPDANRVPLHPPDGGTSINNVSIVLLGEVGSQRFLLAGDVEEGVDPELIGRGLPSLDLLKVAHHGSKTASTEAFLETVRPKVAVVSAGLGNPYGHPAPATLDRLHAIAGKTFRTDLDGSVDVTLDGTSVRVRASGGRPGPAAPTPRPTRAVIATTPSSTFLCAVVPAADGLGTAVVPPPGAPEAPGWPSIRTGPWPREVPTIGRLPELANDPVTARGYHPDDGNGPILGDRAGPRNGAPRLFLGRRRVLARRRGRCVPQGREPLSRRRPGTLAPRRGPGGSRPPPRRDPRAAGHGHNVRRRKPGDRARRGTADPEHRGTEDADRGARRRGARQWARHPRGDGVRSEGSAVETALGGDPRRGWRGPAAPGTPPGFTCRVDRDSRSRA